MLVVLLWALEPFVPDEPVVTFLTIMHRCVVTSELITVPPKVLSIKYYLKMRTGATTREVNRNCRDPRKHT